MNCKCTSAGLVYEWRELASDSAAWRLYYTTVSTDIYKGTGAGSSVAKSVRLGQAVIISENPCT